MLYQTGKAKRDLANCKAELLYLSQLVNNTSKLVSTPAVSSALDSRTKPQIGTPRLTSLPPCYLLAGIEGYELERVC